MKIMKTIMNRHLDGDCRLVSDTVLSYLMRNDYAQTVVTFAKDAGREDLFLRQSGLMSRRQAIRNKLINGDIDGAIADMSVQFPSVMEDHLNLLFLLHTQKFIEMIVAKCSPKQTV